MLKDLVAIAAGPIRRFVITTYAVTTAPSAFAGRLNPDEAESRRAALRYFLEAAGLAVGTAWLLDRVAFSLYAGDGQQVLTVGAVFLMGALIWLVLKMVRTPGLRLVHVYHCYFYSHGALLAVASVVALLALGGLGAAVRAGLVPDLPPCNPTIAACCLETRVPLVSSFADRVERADPAFRTWVSVTVGIGVVLMIAYAWVFATLLRGAKGVRRWKSMTASVAGFFLYFAVTTILVLVVLSKLYPADFAACFPQYFRPPAAG